MAKKSTSYQNTIENYINDINLSAKDRWIAENFHSIREINIDFDTIEYSEEHPLYNSVEPPTDEELSIYKEAVKLLTKKQTDVLNLYSKGLNQQEIADELGIHQTSVYKTLYGNDTYYNGKKVRHGGIIKKLQTLVKKIKDERHNAV